MENQAAVVGFAEGSFVVDRGEHQASDQSLPEVRPFACTRGFDSAYRDAVDLTGAPK